MDTFSSLPYEVIQIVLNYTLKNDCHDVKNLCITYSIFNRVLNEKNWSEYFVTSNINKSIYQNIKIDKKFIVTHGKYLYKINNLKIIPQWNKYKSPFINYSFEFQLRIYMILDNDTGYLFSIDKQQPHVFKFAAMANTIKQPKSICEKLTHFHEWFIYCLTAYEYKFIHIYKDNRFINDTDAWRGYGDLRCNWGLISRLNFLAFI